MLKTSNAASLLALGVMSIATVLASPFDAVSQFSLTTNTATNQWSYWGSPSTTVSTYPGSISLLPVLFNGTCGSGTSCWDTNSGIQNLILQNVTGVDVSGFPNSDARNNQLTFYTRSGIVLVRFLVPVTGTYSLTGFFEGSALAPESSQEFIDINGNTGSPLLNLTGAVPNGVFNPFNFSSLSLNAGDTVDFLVAGTSTDGSNNSLSTGFNATFTTGTSAVPEPGGFVLLAGGLGILAVVKKYKHRLFRAAY
jgi:hypothetical protein